MSRVSVIIPTRGRPQIVGNAIASALNQTYRDLEVIVVIDGPDPPTLEALQAYAEPNLKIVSNLVNLGLAETRNVGVRHASGEWIAFLDDDDEWLPSKIERQIALAEQAQSDRVIVGCRYLEKTAMLERVVPTVLPYMPQDMSEYIYCERGFLQPSTLLTSKKLLETVPFTKGLAIEDTDWLLRAVQDAGARVIVHPETLSIFHNAHAQGRLGGSGAWEPVLAWGIANRKRFTKRSFAVFVVMECVARSRRRGEPFFISLHLLLTGWVLGGFTLASLTYFAAYLFVPSERRRRIRAAWTRTKNFFPSNSEPASMGVLPHE